MGLAPADEKRIKKTKDLYTCRRQLDNNIAARQVRARKLGSLLRTSSVFSEACVQPKAENLASSLRRVGEAGSSGLTRWEY